MVKSLPPWGRDLGRGEFSAGIVIRERKLYKKRPPFDLDKGSLYICVISSY
jgi:hypothetical protein